MGVSFEAQKTLKLTCSQISVIIGFLIAFCKYNLQIFQRDGIDKVGGFYTALSWLREELSSTISSIFDVQYEDDNNVVFDDKIEPVFCGCCFDNCAAQEFLGHKKSWSSGYICRMCFASKDEILKYSELDSNDIL